MKTGKYFEFDTTSEKKRGSRILVYSCVGLLIVGVLCYNSPTLLEKGTQLISIHNFAPGANSETAKWSRSSYDMRYKGTFFKDAFGKAGILDPTKNANPKALAELLFYYAHPTKKYGDALDTREKNALNEFITNLKKGYGEAFYWGEYGKTYRDYLIKVANYVQGRTGFSPDEQGQIKLVLDDLRGLAFNMMLQLKEGKYYVRENNRLLDLSKDNNEGKMWLDIMHLKACDPKDYFKRAAIMFKKHGGTAANSFKVKVQEDAIRTCPRILNLNFVY